MKTSLRVPLLWALVVKALWRNRETMQHIEMFVTFLILIIHISYNYSLIIHTGRPSYRRGDSWAGIEKPFTYSESSVIVYCLDAQWMLRRSRTQRGYADTSGGDLRHWSWIWISVSEVVGRILSLCLWWLHPGSCSPTLSPQSLGVMFSNTVSIRFFSDRIRWSHWRQF